MICGDCGHWARHNNKRGLCRAKEDAKGRRIYTSKNSTCSRVPGNWVEGLTDKKLYCKDCEKDDTCTDQQYNVFYSCINFVEKGD